MLFTRSELLPGTIMRVEAAFKRGLDHYRIARENWGGATGRSESSMLILWCPLVGHRKHCITDIIF